MKGDIKKRVIFCLPYILAPEHKIVTQLTAIHDIKNIVLLKSAWIDRNICQLPSEHF
jgi:hypothetical protein